ncbi:hypothetical protein [Acidocella sp.]|uniref:hypothetical protein n=1 Tax=Acidocella sp. TaxID=50710 RepID=UPI00262BE2DC|nr:hypothetical protein [Acidocella sp.]
MATPTTLDALVRQKLRTWPQHPPGLADHDMGASGAWLRARPNATTDADPPYLKIPGTNRLRTIPDGLWLNFGGTAHDPFVDVFAIEACGSFSNLLDKRSRFAPSMHSLLAVCPLEWLMQPVSAANPMPRWRYTGLLRQAPLMPLMLPVRDLRVMYALRPRQYAGFVSTQIPHAHEFFAPIEALIGPEGWQHPTLRAFIARTSPRANFWDFGNLSAA